MTITDHLCNIFFTDNYCVSSCYKSNATGF